MDARQLMNDRFSVSLMVALGLHVLLLLGLSFTFDINPLRKAAETLDVVLVNWKSESEPDEAEFLAQASQQGGGESEQAQKPSQEISAETPSLDEGDMPVASTEELPTPASEAREQLITESSNAQRIEQITRVEQPDPPMPSAADLMQQSMQAARLQPEVDRTQQFQSKLDRREFISANTREYKYAAYMQAWVAKVERVGNLNYPADLKNRRISGALLMTVGVRRDGSVESINIMESSGTAELDQAAERIVRLAAPYSPLPPDIAETVDILHITRTWQFSHGNVFE